MDSLDFVQVTPRLFLGAAPTNLDNRTQQQQAGEVARCGVGLVVDCRTGANDAELWHKLRIDYLNVGVEDSGAPLPRWFFTDGVEAMLNHWAGNDSSVFIHCEFGVARSPALTFAVLIADGITTTDAIQTIESNREEAADLYFPSALDWYRWFSGEATN
jgi:predicted protein tyrosine phosphatase